MGHNPFDDNYWAGVKAAGGETREQYKTRVETHLGWSLNTLERAGYRIERPDETTIEVEGRLSIKLAAEGPKIPETWGDIETGEQGVFDAKARRLDYWVKERLPLD